MVGGKVVAGVSLWKEIVNRCKQTLGTTLALRRLGAGSRFTRSTSRRHCLRSARWWIVVLGLATARRLKDTHECVPATIHNGTRIYHLRARLD